MADAEAPDTIPAFVTPDKVTRWENSLKVAGDLFPGNRTAVWGAARAIFDDPVSYPD